MTVKRKNHGRSKKNRGHTDFIRCDNCHRACPKDKAIKRTHVKNVIEAAAADDLRNATLYDEFEIPKYYDRMALCISCAMHKKIVRVRSAEDRKKRGTGIPSTNLV